MVDVNYFIDRLGGDGSIKRTHYTIRVDNNRQLNELLQIIEFDSRAEVTEINMLNINGDDKNV